jgi:hypothetical protein
MHAEGGGSTSERGKESGPTSISDGPVGWRCVGAVGAYGALTLLAIYFDTACVLASGELMAALTLMATTLSRQDGLLPRC